MKFYVIQYNNVVNWTVITWILHNYICNVNFHEWSNQKREQLRFSRFNETKTDPSWSVSGSWWSKTNFDKFGISWQDWLSTFRLCFTISLPMLFCCRISSFRSPDTVEDISESFNLPFIWKVTISGFLKSLLKWVTRYFHRQESIFLLIEEVGCGIAEILFSFIFYTYYLWGSSIGYKFPVNVYSKYESNRKTTGQTWLN